MTGSLRQSIQDGLLTLFAPWAGTADDEAFCRETERIDLNRLADVLEMIERDLLPSLMQQPDSARKAALEALRQVRSDGTAVDLRRFFSRHLIALPPPEDQGDFFDRLATRLIDELRLE